MGHTSRADSHDTNEVDVDSDDLREIIAAVQQAEETARQCHEENERTRLKFQSSVGDDKSLQNHRVSGGTYSSDDGASSVEYDRELRAAAKRERAQFQNLRNKRAVLEEKLQKLSISLREDCRIAKRARYQLTDKVWNWLNSAFMDAIPIMGVHLGPDHIDTVGTAEPSEAAFSDRSLAGNASIHTGDDETMEGKEGEQLIASAVASVKSLEAADWRSPKEVRQGAASTEAGRGPVLMHQTSFGGSSSGLPSGSKAAAAVVGQTELGAGQTDALGGKRKVPGTAGAPNCTTSGADLDAKQLCFSASMPLWLAQAEAAQAVLQSSHRALDQWHQHSFGPAKQTERAEGNPEERAAVGGEAGPSEQSNGFGDSALSKSFGGTFTMGHNQGKPDGDAGI